MLRLCLELNDPGKRDLFRGAELDPRLSFSVAILWIASNTMALLSMGNSESCD